MHPTFHVSLLKPYRGEPPLKPAVVVDGSREYEVEAILNHKQRWGKELEFMVKWKGYGDHENSWEPESNLLNCARLLGEYKTAHALYHLFCFDRADLERT